MPKILFIASHRKDRAPGQRFRFEQYMQFLSENGFPNELSFLVTEKDDKILYTKRNYHKKYLFSLRSLAKRRADLKRLNEFDIVFIFREALMTRSTFFEKAAKARGKKLVFDFDDAIWLMNVSDANKWFSFMKNPDKTKQLIALSDMIFAGNQYLADYASQFNKNVKIIPTTIDTEEYKPVGKKPTDKITIGWSGSITTIQHFEYALPFLREVKTKYGDTIEILVIGDKSYRNEELNIQGKPWKKETELRDLSQIDIGIMPLPDDEWAKGKCGLKGLQYMALAIPTIMSPVGVNTEIIQDGENGFLATTAQDWIEKLSRLIEDEALRRQIGDSGRETVEEKYSVNALRQTYLNLFNEVINK
jgi:glycosyltransferase involved in cell wall biosynthesis